MINPKKDKFLYFFTIFSSLLIFYGTFLDFTNLLTFSVKDYLGLVLSIGSSILGIAFVILEVKALKSMFVVGIIGSFFSMIYLLFWSPLLWDMAIMIIYIILNIYGLYYWNHPNKNQQDQNHQITTKTLSLAEWIPYLIYCGLGIGVLSFLGIMWGRYASPLQAITDATTTSISILAQWFVSKKYFEMWYLWILVNIISIPLYISIQAYVYVMVYICYLSVSFYGCYYWKKNMLFSKDKVSLK